MSAANILKSMKCAPKLDKSTYNRWSTHFLDALSLFEIDDYILENKTVLDNRAASKFENSKYKALDPVSTDVDLVIKQDRNIRVAISQLVPDIVFHLVHPSYTAKQCWDNLKQFYRPNTDEDIDDLLQDFWGLIVEDDVEIDDFVQKLTEIRGRISLIDTNSIPSDSSMKKRVLTHFIKCCGGFYMSTVIPLKDSAITFQSAVTSLRASQSVYKELHSTSIVALAGHGNSSNPSSYPKNPKSCAHCKRRGHLRENCFIWLDTPDGSKWAAKNPEKAAKTKRLREKLNKKKNNEKSTPQHQIKTAEDSDGSQSGAWMTEENVLATHNAVNSSDVVLDTGATNHIFNDRSFFTTISPSKKSIVTASGDSIPVFGVGNVQFKVFNYFNQKSKLIKMENVWYVPSCTKNLVSGIQLLAKGYKISSLSGSLSILSDNGKIIATARPKSGLFCFNTYNYSSSIHAKCLPTENYSNVLSPNTQELATKLIHHRLAHVGPHLLKNIDVSEFDLPILKSRTSKDFFIDKIALNSCDVCNSCKQVEKINKGPVLKSCGILDLIHSDTWGKCRVPGVFGSFHFVTFTDDFTRECTLYLMKNKSEVPFFFKKFKEQKELQTGRSIKAMRFDGGTEYKNIDFGGISKQISAPYTQHQNGVSERLNRSIITMARCMLSHARLPLRFWDAAVLTACYLRNRLRILQGNQSPYELMNGHSPEFSHLRVWGCICYALIDDKDPQRYKLKPTSFKGIFIGYCESITQYRVYIPSKPGTNKVIISANVKFMEDSFWDWNESLSEELSESDKLLRKDLGSTSIEIESESESEVESDVPVVQPESQTQSFIGPHESVSLEENLNNQATRNESNCSSAGSSSPSQSITNLRRSSRLRKPIEPRSAWQPVTRALHTDTKSSTPQNYSEAINGSEKSKWQAAIDEELESMRTKNVFSQVTHIPHDRKPVGSRWVFTIKSDGRYRARLVAQGFSQVYGIDYFDTYSPTLQMDSLRILLAVAAFRDWEIHQVDVKTAYLEADLNEDIYIKRPEGMAGTKYVKLNKSLYGLKQSGRAWYEKLDTKLSSLGFEKSEYDQCIYIHSKLQLVIGVYVDDLVICGKVYNDVKDIKQKLSSFFPIKDLGPIDTIIGWKISRERSSRTLKISQAHYLTEKVKSFGLEDGKIVSSPLEGYHGILPKQDEEKLADESAYASAIGSLGYASSSTRPDISFAVSQLGSFNSSPAIRHWNCVCRLLRYIKGSKDYHITYSFGPHTCEIIHEMKATLYSDSDFASDIITRRSVSGYIMMLGNGPVSWQSRRQKSVSTSTAEAEYVALFEASKNATWLTGFLNELHVSEKLIDDSGILTFTDNQSAMAIAKGVNSTKTRHIDVAYHYVRKCVQNGIVSLNYIPSAEMLADILTKPLPCARVKTLCENIFKF